MSQITETEIKKLSKEQNYFRGYQDCKEDMMSVIEDIKAEIKEGIDACNNILQMGIFLEPKSSIEARKLTYEQCLEFIDKNISGKE